MRLAAGSKLLSERHVEDKDSFGSCLLIAEAGSCRQSCVLVKLVVVVEDVADQAVLKLGCSSCSSVRCQAGSLKALC